MKINLNFGVAYLLCVCILIVNASLQAQAKIESQPRELINIGRSPYALTSPKFHCADFLKSMRSFKVLNIAFLYNTFGNDFDCIKTLMQDDRLARLQISLINEPCHRNHRCEKHEFLKPLRTPARYRKLLKSNNALLKQKFDNYIAPLRKLLSEHLQAYTTCFISPGLESNLDVRAARQLINWSREAFPQCKLVWNPHRYKGSAQEVGADFIEAHGTHPKVKAPCIINNDGTDIHFPERPALAALRHVSGRHKNWIRSGNHLQNYIRTYAANCEMALLWTAEDNCFDFAYRGNWIPPLQRSCQSGDINQLVAREIRKLIK